MEKRPSGELWVIVLAAGEGTRIRGLLTDVGGAIAPKQYCTLDGAESILRWTVRRASRLVPRRRIVAVVAARHRRWWKRELSDLPPENILAQPANRGTAAGILLPLFRVLERDPQARVVILPSDHFVGDERRLRRAMIRAVAAIDVREARIALLGMVPDEPDGDYGWIVPRDRLAVSPVSLFVEKPDPQTARSLVDRGALVNSFIIAARAEALAQCCARAVPRLAREFADWRTHGDGRWSERVTLYDSVPDRDFSRDVLERSAARLVTLRAADCSWTDLGTPSRLSSHRHGSVGRQWHRVCS